MTLSNMIYGLLRKERGALMPLEVADLLKNPCSHRNYLKLLNEEEIEKRAVPAEKLLLNDAANIFRKDHFRKYLKGAFGQDYAPPEEVLAGGVVLVRYEGFLQDVPVFLETVSSDNYKGGMLPKRLALLAAARASLLGQDIAYVIVMDQNTQSWNAWTVTGEFEEIQEFLLKEIEYLRALAVGDDVPELGVSSCCGSCPFEKVCDVVEKIPEAGPLPRPRLKSVVDTGLVQHIDQHLEDLNKKHSNRKTGVIHPSELSISKCDRSIAYGLLGIEGKSNISPNLRRIFDMGHSFHDFIQSAMQFHYGENCELEATAEHKDLKIYGHCDAVLPGEAVEIKSISTKGAEKLSKPKKEHEDQGTIYATAPGIAKEIVTYLYANKDTGELKEYKKKVSRTRWHRIAGRAAGIVKTVKEGKLPDQVDKDYICESCKYTWHCKPGFIKKGFRL
jgi:hypothetical protein